MPLVYTVYTSALAYVVTVALAMLAYGGLDHVRRPDESTGVLEAGAGAVVLVFLVAFHFEGLTESIYRQLVHGSFVSKSFVVLPMVGGVVTTDYLLRRIVPLVDAAIRSVAPLRPSDGDAERGTRERRRSVVAGALGVIAASLSGGFVVLDDFLRSPSPGTEESTEFRRRATFEAPYFPTALDFTEDGYGFLTTIEGKIFRFERPVPEQESVQFTKVADGIRYPQGVEVYEGTLYTVDNGAAAGGKYDVEDGYEVLQESNGTVIAFDVESDGSLSNRRTVVSNLPVVNSDHALHQIEAGPDGRLYLSIGHLGGQKYPEMFDGQTYEPGTEDHPGYEYLGTVVSFEPDGSDLEVFARGLRNVYDLAFDDRGNLFGANNDGMSVRSKVWESLCHITEDAHFGYPEYGTFDQGPPDEAIRDPLWTLDGVQSTGVETTDGIGARNGVVVGLAGKVVFLPIERGEAGLYVPEFLRTEPTVVEPEGAPIVVEAGPDGYLWIGLVGRDDTFELYEPAS